MKQKTININLFDVQSIQKALEELRRYELDLRSRCERLCERLAEEGIKVAKASIGDSGYGKSITITSKISPEEAGCQAIIMATGKTVKAEDGRDFNLLLAVEFGAGIKYNPVANPMASELGYGVGTFPGQTHAFDPKGWYYLGSDGQWHHSYGVKATMPMYKAMVAIKEKLDAVVKEVFG